MNNGNATFCGWLRLCVFLLAILPALKAQTFQATVPFPESYGLEPVVCVLVVGNEGGGWATFSQTNGQSFSLRLNGSGSYFIYNSVSVNLGISAQSILLEASVGGDWVSMGTLEWQGTVTTGTLQVFLEARNNLNRAQTITVGNAPSQQLGPLAQSTLIFTVTGTPGAVVAMGASPDMLTEDMAYDPLIIPTGSGTAVRSVHIGQPAVTKWVNAVFINYNTSLVQMIPKLDGIAMGMVDAQGSEDGVTPKSTSYDWALELSPSSVLTFAAPPGQSASVQMYQVGDVLSYVVTIGSPNPQTTSTTTDPTNGQTTTTTTDPITGTTTIDRTTPSAPTNTNTNPGSVFGGNNTGGANTGKTYTNTSPQAGSAASQDAANSLAAIAADTKRIRENSDVQRTDHENNLSLDSKAQVKNFLSQYSNPSGAASDAMNGIQGNANQASTNAGVMVSAKVGIAGMGNLDAPTSPNPGTVELKVGPGKTINVNLNPFSPDGPLGGLVALAAAFIKRLIAWALVAAFFYEVMKEVRGVVGTAFLTGGYTSQTVDMIKSVNIFGWSVGVPVGGVVRIALIALIVTLVLTLPAAALAALEGGLPWQSLRDVYTQGAPGTGGGSLATALGYVDYVLPWRLMMTLPLYYILVHNVLFPLQVFWQMIFKFLP